MYTMLEREASAAGLPLHWPPRLRDTRNALAAAQWTRRHRSDVSGEFIRALFAAHFALGENLGDPAVIDQHAQALGIDLATPHAALVDGSAAAHVEESERLGRQVGVQGTPAWLIDGRLVLGLQPADVFEQMAEAAARGRENLSPW